MRHKEENIKQKKTKENKIPIKTKKMEITK